MSDRTIDQPDKFDRLLDAMPRIGEAFSSPKTQRAALDALVRSLGVPERGATAIPSATNPKDAEEHGLSVVPPLGDVAEEQEISEAQTAAEAGEARPARKARVRKPAAKKSFSRVKDINFRPEDKVSLRDFAAEKSPSNFHEKSLITVYYLEEFLEVEAIEIGHLLAAYDECGWKSPSDPENSVAVTASRKNWLDTSDRKAIKTTHSGRNAVQYDMPFGKDNKTA